MLFRFFFSPLNWNTKARKSKERARPSISHCCAHFWPIFEKKKRKYEKEFSFYKKQKSLLQQNTQLAIYRKNVLEKKISIIYSNFIFSVSLCAFDDLLLSACCLLCCRFRPFCRSSFFCISIFFSIHSTNSFFFHGKIKCFFEDIKTVTGWSMMAGNSIWNRNGNEMLRGEITINPRIAWCPMWVACSSDTCRRSIFCIFRFYLPLAMFIAFAMCTSFSNFHSLVAINAIADGLWCLFVSLPTSYL